MKTAAPSPKSFAIRGRATITVAAAAEDGKPAKRPTFAISAYNGGELRIGGLFRPVVIDLAKLRHSKNVPVLLDHRTDQIVGQAQAVEVTRKGVSLSGIITGDDEHAERVVSHARNGFKWQASVGVEVLKFESVGDRESVSVNGKTFTGPLLVARSGVLREVSIVAVGADETSSAQIAARRGMTMAKRHNVNKPGRVLDPVQVAAAIEDTELDLTNEDELIEAGGDGASIEGIRAEHARIARINAICDGHPEIAAKAIEEGWTTNRAELIMIRASRSTVNPILRSSPGGAPVDVLQASLFRLVGREEAGAKALGERTMTAAAGMRINSLNDLCLAALRIEGRDVPHGRDAMIRAAFSTISLPIALGGGLERILIDQLAQHPATWRSIAKRIPVPNFKEQTLVRMILGGGGLEKVPKDGEIKHASLEETSRSVQADTFAKMITLTRQDIINDNLSAFNDLPAIFALEWSRLLADLVWGVVLANAGDFFHADNNNLLTGATSVLDADGLGAAISALRKMTDEKGRLLDITPAVLAVSPELEQPGRALLNSTEVGRDDAGPTGNPLKGVASLEVEPRISAEGYAGSSDVQWFLFGPAQLGAVNLALLNGRDTPTVEIADTEFNKLGMSWRVFGDAGAALGESRAAVRADGE